MYLFNYICKIVWEEPLLARTIYRWTSRLAGTSDTAGWAPANSATLRCSACGSNAYRRPRPAGSRRRAAYTRCSSSRMACDRCRNYRRWRSNAKSPLPSSLCADKWRDEMRLKVPRCEIYRWCEWRVMGAKWILLSRMQNNQTKETIWTRGLDGFNDRPTYAMQTNADGYKINMIYILSKRENVVQTATSTEWATTTFNKDSSSIMMSYPFYRFQHQHLLLTLTFIVTWDYY